MQRIYVTIRPLNREDSVLYFPPEAFGPFRVLHQIGAGTLGPVFRAYEPGRDRLVAVKVFRLDLTPEQTAALGVQLEALLDAAINHPNIAAPIAAGIEHGAAYLAQEYAVGESLDVVLRERGSLPIPEVVSLVESLAEAIDHAAGSGVHHGLLHLRDILVGSDTARITGFGIAAALSKIGAKLPTRPAYSLSHETAGKPARDIYSLGAIAFEAATGKRVSEDNLKEFEARHGIELRGAFAVALGTDPDSPARRARDVADVLREAADLTAEATADFPPSPGQRRVSPELVGNSRAAADRSAVPDAPIDDPLDREIDLGARPELDLDEPASPPSHAPQAPGLFSGQAQASDLEPEKSNRRWLIVVVFLVFAVLAALSVGFFLRSPRSAPAAETAPGVDSTIVDLPASPSAQPPPIASGDKPAPNALVPNAPNAPGTAAPSASASAPTSPIATADKPKPTQTGSVLIRSTPADADVLVNGKPRGKTPLALRDLALGSYTIRVARDGYVAEERTLRLDARQPSTSTTIILRSTARPGLPAKGGAGATAGVLNVQSRPAGARVFVNNRLAGSTPIAIPGLPAGPATVRIEMDGYRQWTTKVQVNAGEQTRVAASLERP